MPNLYELASQYKQFYEYLENELESDDTISEDTLQVYFDTLEAVQEPFEHKAENIVKFLRNIEGDIEAYKREKLRLERKQKILQNKYDGLKKWLKESLEQNGIEKVNAGQFNVRLQKNPDSLEVVDEKKIPSSYIVKTEYTYDKKTMLEKIKNGEEIEGVQLAPASKHIRIS